MGFLGDLSGSTSAGGSINNSMSVSNSFTNGTAASQYSAEQAAQATATAYEYWKKAAEYNSEQAKITRDWQEKMANSVYQRTIEDMRKAGINPVLAAGMGLGSASVGSGATASMSSPSVFMGSSFPDTNSSSTANSNGKSWQQSESGLATGLQLMGEAIAGALSTMNTGSTINYVMSELGGAAKTTWNDIKKLMIDNLPTSIVRTLGLEVDASSSSASGTGAPTRKKTITGKGTLNGTGHSGSGHNF